MNAEPLNRSLPPTAVASALVGLATAITFIVPELAVLGLVGIALGMIALASIARYEMSGRWLAVIGVTSSLVFAIAGPLVLSRQFQDEAPPDYQRIDFSKVVTADVEQADAALKPLLGQRICLKGYLPPELISRCPNEFTLTPDGASPTHFDKNVRQGVVVKLDPAQQQRPSYPPIAVSGILVLNPAHTRNPLAPKYELDAAIVRQSRTRFQLAARMIEGC